jgi:hypothetical protein
MAHNPFNRPGFFGSEDEEKMNKKRGSQFKTSKETNDLLAEMQRLGSQKFREMFGQEIFDQLKEIAAEEKRLYSTKEKIRLQSKLKGDYPMCEKCVNWDGVTAKSKPCPWDKDFEKNIVFDKGELSNEFETEICEHFVWRKDT